MSDRIRKVGIWCFLTQKRLLKKGSYLAMLCLLPVMMLCLRLASGQESSIITIGIYSQGSYSNTIAGELTEKEKLLRFVSFQSEEEAVRAVEKGDVQAAFLLPEDTEEKLITYARGNDIAPVVTIVEREEDISNLFVREILCSRIVPRFIYEMYRSYIVQDIGLSGISDEELRAHYLQISEDTVLFEARYPDGSLSDGSNYLVAPTRGMLAIWLVLAGFGATLYHKRDEQQGMYASVPVKKRILYLLGIEGITLADGCLICLLGCFAAGIGTGFLKEAFLWLFLGIVILMFCTFLSFVLKTQGRICMAAVFGAILMLVFCPVFMEIGEEWFFKWIFPPYFYLQSLYSNFYIGCMAAYAAIGATLCFLAWFISSRKA